VDLEAVAVIFKGIYNKVSSFASSIYILLSLNSRNIITEGIGSAVCTLLNLDEFAEFAVWWMPFKM
jgi:hypothetical protein